MRDQGIGIKDQGSEIRDQGSGINVKEGKFVWKSKDMRGTERDINVLPLQSLASLTST